VKICTVTENPRPEKGTGTLAELKGSKE